MDCVVELSCLSADLIILGIFYKLYRDKTKSINAIKNAPEIVLDKHLKHKLEQGVINYAIVRGTVYSSVRPIPSQHVPGIAGVIQESAVVEHKVQWNPFSRLWSVAQHEIQSFRNSVPFHISNNSTWNRVKIEVIDPMSSQELPLMTIYDKFTPKTDTFGDFVWGWFRGERSKGFQVTEQMLTEGTILTGIGQLIVEDKQIKLVPPEKLAYYLTTLTPEGLMKKLNKDGQVFKAFATVFGILGAYFVTLIARSWYMEHKKSIDKKRREEDRKNRRKMARTANSEDPNSPVSATLVCVICVTNPVEVLLLDCGHLCLCVDCCDQVRSCPICRASIASTVAAFLP